jgi:hypothetical protein
VSVEIWKDWWILVKRKRNKKQRLLAKAEKEILEFCDEHDLPKEYYVFEIMLDVLEDSPLSSEMDKKFADEVKRRLIEKVKTFVGIIK